MDVNRPTANTPPASDPDRFINLTRPGSQEWWYFDAVSDDGRDALVLIYFAALPFDPAYGVATLRHRKNPTRYPAPRPLDHCAINLNWYRNGKLVGYALNGYRAEAFTYREAPFAVAIAATNRIDRNPDGSYNLSIETPAVDDRQRLSAALRFTPASGTEPFERDLGSPDSPHLWMLAAADGRLEGSVALEGRGKALALDFRGRGYHDHNAGADDLTVSMKRWAWGRFHHGRQTHVYYRSEPRPGHGADHGLWITCENGRPAVIRDDAEFDEIGRGGNVFGIRHGRHLRVGKGTSGFLVNLAPCAEDGPFYRRWVSSFSPFGGLPCGGEGGLPGISELLDTRNLHSPLFNWMIPYRLKRPVLISK